MPVFILEDSDYIQTLMNLGLTLLQAKTYLALAKLGRADAKTIAKASNVVREEIYRTMPRLAKYGLVEKIITRPTLYKALPLKEGLSMLIQRRTEENTELQKKTRTLINNLEDHNLRKAFQEESSQFIITSEITLFRKRFEIGIKMAQISIDIVGSLKLFEEMMYHHLTSFKRALAKGVKIRVITEEAEDETTLRKFGVLKEKRLFELKYLYAPLPVTMAVFDNKEIDIRISNDLVPNLWSNNPQIVKLVSGYFEDMWDQAR